MKYLILALLLLTSPALADEALDGTEPLGDAAYGPSKGTVYTDGSVEGEPEGTVHDVPGDTDHDGQLSDAEDAAAHPAYGPSSLDRESDGTENHGRGGKTAGDGPGGGGQSNSSHGSGSKNGSTSSGGGKQSGDGPGGN